MRLIRAFLPSLAGAAAHTSAIGFAQEDDLTTCTTTDVTIFVRPTLPPSSAPVLLLPRPLHRTTRPTVLPP